MPPGRDYSVGERMAAGRAARMVAWITGNVFGDWAVQSGWFARAVTNLKEAGEDGPERGWVLIIKSFPDPDVGTGEAMLQEAVEIRRRHGDPDVEFEALSYLAGLEPPTPELRQLLAAMAGNQEAMDGFARVNAGVTSPAEFFSEENAGRIMAGSAAAANACSRAAPADSRRRRGLPVGPAADDAPEAEVGG
jgi:hypothetical protein